MGKLESGTISRGQQLVMMPNKVNVEVRLKAGVNWCGLGEIGAGWRKLVLIQPPFDCDIGSCSIY